MERVGKITISYTYTHGSIDAKHAEKHEEKMETSQYVTGDAEIDRIFDKKFIDKVRASNPTSYGSKQNATQPSEEEEEEEEAESDFEWLRE